MTNREIVMALYAAFEGGDMDAVTGLMADDIEWREAESNTLADRNPYIGPQAVMEGVAVEIGSVVEDGETVVMQGRYRARARASGTQINPQIVHWWTVRDGRIAAYQQHVDTFALASALGEPL
jgi:hypothetical protein